MATCAILTCPYSDVEAPLLHYLYKDGENLVGTGRESMELEFCRRLSGGFRLICDITKETPVYWCDNIGVMTHKIGDTYFLLTHPGRIQEETLRSALHFVISIASMPPSTPRDSLMNSSAFQRWSIPMLNSFLYRFFESPTMAAALLRSLFVLRLPRDVITPALAGAVTLKHMHTLFQAIGGVIICSGRILVSSVGIFASHLALLRTVVDETNDDMTRSIDGVLRANIVSLSQLRLPRVYDYGDMETITSRVQRVRTSNHIHTENALDQSSISALSESSCNAPGDETFFHVQLLLIKIYLGENNAGDIGRSYIALVLYIPFNKEVTLTHDSLKCIAQSLLLINGKLLSHLRSPPLYPYATRHGVQLQESPVDILGPALFTPLSEEVIVHDSAKETGIFISSSIGKGAKIRSTMLSSQSGGALMDDENGMTTAFTFTEHGASCRNLSSTDSIIACSTDDDVTGKS